MLTSKRKSIAKQLKRYLKSGDTKNLVWLAKRFENHHVGAPLYHRGTYFLVRYMKQYKLFPYNE